MFKEKRKYPRFSLCLPIKIFNKSLNIVTETKNISGNGAYCTVNENIELMTKLKIILLVPVIKKDKKVLKRINCKGVVVRREYVKENGKRLYNIGIFFSEIKEKDRKLLLSYLNTFRPS
ncbi:MAG: hypothetical protein B6D55_08075 [Candidatus Omnitrophica bacterium 4484_70.2]|nr:MAG: hypothetical protein B6D55_08075 [Candidatus Omnitrophica bacterium 4484_70.2]